MSMYYIEGKRSFWRCARWENPYEYGSYAANEWNWGYDSEEAELNG